MKIQAFKAKFDPVFLAYMEQRIQAYTSRCPDEFLAKINKHTLELIRGGGKRVRPYMAYTMYEMLGGRMSKAVLELFGAIELFHVFALVHDDIIDHGNERHGVPTLHRFVEQLLQKEKRIGELEHIAKGQAMLVGDFLHASAYDLILRGLSVAPKHLSRVYQEFNHMVEEVMLGEALDVDTATRSKVTSELIDSKMYLKTASYTFVRPMKMGAALAGSSKAVDVFCEKFGRALGLAFQIQDDLLDLTAPQATVHKSVFSDLRERQHTVFTQYIVEHGSEAQRQELASLLGVELQEKDRKRVETLFKDSGALAHGRSLMDEHFHVAEHLLRTLALPARRKQPLVDLVAYLRERSY